MTDPTTPQDDVPTRPLPAAGDEAGVAPHVPIAQAPTEPLAQGAAPVAAPRPRRRVPGVVIGIGAAVAVAGITAIVLLTANGANAPEKPVATPTPTVSAPPPADPAVVEEEGGEVEPADPAPAPPAPAPAPPAPEPTTEPEPTEEPTPEPTEPPAP